MAYQNLPVPFTYQPQISRSPEDESEPSIPIGLRRRTPDEESLVRQPPKPAELNSLNSEPDPDLQLTPLKQKEQPKGLLRSQTGHSKVRHRVHFQDPRSFSCESESEQDISTRISDCELEQENRNNNSRNIDYNSFPDVSPPNPSNCMFFDANSDVFAPQPISVEVVREINQGQKPPPPPPPTLTSDFPSEAKSRTDRNNSANSQPYCKTDYESETPLSDVSAETAALRNIYLENLTEEGNGSTAQKKKPTKSNLNRPNHSQGVGADLHPSSLRTSPSPIDASSVDKEASLFGQPQLHSTLHIAQKIKTLQKKRPDLTSELKKNLEKEEQRNKINGKAASKVDIHSNQDLYTGLISLDISNLQLEEAAMVQRVTKVKHAKKKMTNGLEPDLLEFFTEDLQKETADFSLPGIPSPAIETCKAPSLIAFDLYRHNRVWEGLPGTV